MEALFYALLAFLIAVYGGIALVLSVSYFWHFIDVVLPREWALFSGWITRRHR